MQLDLTSNLTYEDPDLDLVGVEECDWSEARCPVCNRMLDSHDSQRMTRCALTQFNTKDVT